MGTYGNGDDKPRGKGRGSTNNKARLSAFAKPGNGGQADWGTAKPEWIAAVVTAITLKGGAATFGLSRDGGAHMLTLLLDGDRQTLWFNGDADLDLELENVFAVIETLA